MIRRVLGWLQRQTPFGMADTLRQEMEEMQRRARESAPAESAPTVIDGSIIVAGSITAERLEEMAIRFQASSRQGYVLVGQQPESKTKAARPGVLQERKRAIDL